MHIWPLAPSCCLAPAAMLALLPPCDSAPAWMDIARCTVVQSQADTVLWCVHRVIFLRIILPETLFHVVQRYKSYILAARVDTTPNKHVWRASTVCDGDVSCV
jgi:hypothetical protein